MGGIQSLSTLLVACSVHRQESIRTAFLLSQGGEFAFVLLSLANELKVLLTGLKRLLIIRGRAVHGRIQTQFIVIDCMLIYCNCHDSCLFWLSF